MPMRGPLIFSRLKSDVLEPGIGVPGIVVAGQHVSWSYLDPHTYTERTRPSDVALRVELEFLWDSLTVSLWTSADGVSWTQIYSSGTVLPTVKGPLRVGVPGLVQARFRVDYDVYGARLPPAAPSPPGTSITLVVH